MSAPHDGVVNGGVMLHSNVERLLLAMIDVPIDAVMTFDQMSVIAGHRVSGGSFEVQHAVGRARDEFQMLFVNVRGVGYRRLGDSGVVGQGGKLTDNVRRCAKLGQLKLAVVKDYQALSRDERCELDTRRTVLNAAIMASSPRVVEATRKKVADGNGQLSVQATIAAFSALEVVKDTPAQTAKPKKTA